MRLFASLYPDEVAGLVLVDAGNSDTLPDDYDFSPPSFIHIAHHLRHFGFGRLMVSGFSISPDHDPSRVERFFEMYSRSNSVEALYQQAIAAADCWLDVRSKMRNLGDMPVTVISPTGSAEEMSSFYPWWEESQEALAKSVGRNVVVLKPECGHGVQFEKPDVLFDAIKQMLERVSSNS